MPITVKIPTGAEVAENFQKNKISLEDVKAYSEAYIAFGLFREVTELRLAMNAIPTKITKG